VESFEEELDGTDDAVAELVVGEAETHGGDIIDVDLESVVVCGGEGFGSGADSLHTLDELWGGPKACPLEEHVLDTMREAVEA